MSKATRGNCNGAQLISKIRSFTRSKSELLETSWHFKPERQARLQASVVCNKLDACVTRYWFHSFLSNKYNIYRKNIFILCQFLALIIIIIALITILTLFDNAIVTIFFKLFIPLCFFLFLDNKTYSKFYCFRKEYWHTLK